MTTYDRVEFLRDILGKVVKMEGFDCDCKITIENDSQEFGGGFLGIISTAEVTSNNRNMKLFIKTATTNEHVRQQAKIKDIYAREIYFYSTLQPEFLKFQVERNVKQPFTNTAKCYFTSQENLREVLVLENLKERGFVMCEKEVPMNEQHITSVFKLYAKFHAVSYVMKDQKPELYAKLSENLNDLLEGFMKGCRADLKLKYESENIKTAFDPVQDAHILNRIKDLADVLLNAVIRPQDFVDEYSVITHGDCWRNNFLFKYKDPFNQNTPEDVKFLDWQVMRVSSPVADLSYFFYCVTTKPDLRKLDFYLKIYYDALSDSIREMGSVPKKLYPYSVFREHWRKFSKFGLSLTFMLLKVMLSENNEVPDMNNVGCSKTIGDLFMYKIAKEDVYKQRMKDLVEHFVNNDFL